MVDIAARLPLIESELEDEELGAVSAPPALPPEPRILDGLLSENTTFDQFADYAGVTFTDDVVLRNVRFAKGFSFAGAVFQGRTRFFGVTNERAKGSRADFAGAKFHGSAQFNQRASLYLANFEGAVFGDTAKFQGCRFYASANFDKALFSASANFKGATFNGSGNFSQARFESIADFDEAVFRYPLSHARFVSSRFVGPAHFNEARFCGSADFTEAVFSQGATFHRARFDLLQKEAEPETDEDEASLLHDEADVFVCFDRCTFHADDEGQVATFEWAKFGDRNFRREISFDGAYFRPSIGPSKQPPQVVFQRALFLGSTSFSQAQFATQVAGDFTHTRFEDKLDLSDCLFAGPVSFEKAQFRQDVVLAQAGFKDYPDFRQATFTHAPELADAHFPDKAPGKRKTSVPRIGALRRIAARTDDKRTEFDLLVRELKAEGGFASKLYGLVCNYGKSWLRPTLWLAMFTLIVFPLLYLAANDRLPRYGVRTPDASITGLACADGGSPIAASLELSVKNALIVAPENEMQARRISDCLGAPATSGTRSLVSMTLQAAQIVLTLVMIFFIGGAIRRRLQMR